MYRIQEMMRERHYEDPDGRTTILLEIIQPKNPSARNCIGIYHNCDVLPKTSNIHSQQMVLLQGGGVDNNGKRRERASDDGAA